MSDLAIEVVNVVWSQSFPPVNPVSFTSPVHASLDGYWFRWNDGSNVVDNSDYWTTGQVTYAAGVVTVDMLALNRSGLTPATTYSVEVRTQQTVGGVVLYGPWSDTGYDYTA